MSTWQLLVHLGVACGVLHKRHLHAPKGTGLKPNSARMTKRRTQPFMKGQTPMNILDVGQRMHVKGILVAER
jgi:hypothetical protein